MSNYGELPRFSPLARDMVSNLETCLPPEFTSLLKNWVQHTELLEEHILHLRETTEAHLEYINSLHRIQTCLLYTSPSPRD